jgi:hypothetical protein
LYQPLTSDLVYVVLAVFFFCASDSKLRALAWNGATSAVQEAVASVEAGHPPPHLLRESTLTIADAITLRQLGGSIEETIAKLIDSDERSAKPNATKSRIFRVVKAARAGVYHGFDKLDSGSVSAFLASPMRANIPPIARVTKRLATLPACDRSSENPTSYIAFSLR